MLRQHDELTLRRLPDLRLALRVDAVASGTMGVLQLVAAPLLHDHLGPSVTLLRAVGLFLLGFAGALWLTAARPVVDPRAGWAVVAANGAWVALSAAVVVGDWLDLTGLGVAYVLVQAVAVLVFADLQVLALRRQPDRP